MLIVGWLLILTGQSGAEQLKASMAEGLVALITLMTLINVAMLAFMLAMRRGHNGQFSKKRGHEDDPGTLQVARQEIAKLKEQHTNEPKDMYEKGLSQASSTSFIHATPPTLRFWSSKGAIIFECLLLHGAWGLPLGQSAAEVARVAQIGATLATLDTLARHCGCYTTDRS